MKGLVEQVKRLPASDRARIEGVIPEAVFREIEETSTFAWLPFEVNLRVTRAVAESLGPRRAHEFFLDLMKASFEGPLLKSLVDAVLRLRGNDPTVMLQWVSKGFELMFKDAGTWSVVDRGEGAASLEVTGLPQEARSDRIWLESVSSSLTALFGLADVRGVTTIREIDEARSAVVFRLRWEKV